MNEMEPMEALRAPLGRGRHLALIASEGAGLAEIYAAATVHDLAGISGQGHAMVLTASLDRARRCAARMHPVLDASGHSILVVTPGLALEDSDETVVFVGPPGLCLEAVRRGQLSADRLRTMILDDVKALQPAWVAVEALLQIGDKETRRIAATHERDRTFHQVLERWLPRARRWPEELFRDGESATALPGTTAESIATAAVPTRESRLARLAELVTTIDESQRVEDLNVETSPDVLAEVRAAVSVAGFEVAGADDSAFLRVGCWGELPPAEAVISFELPPSAAALATSVASTTHCYAIVDPLHRRQLELMAQRSGLTLTTLPDAPDPALVDDIESFRRIVAEAVEKEDLATGLLLISPLVEAHGAAQVAAALASLVRATTRTRPPVRTREARTREARIREPRTRASRPREARPHQQRRPQAPAPRARVRDHRAERASRGSWTRMWVDVGRRDGAGPGDIVGAITGETVAKGPHIGRIDIRQNFSLVDLDSLIVDDVIRDLQGSLIKGREVNTRRDRHGGG